jgi:hypothetical protein
MSLCKKENLIFSGIVIFAVIIAWIIQANLFLNWDISGLLNSTRLMLAGGSYSHDFFTANPPMIFYLYMPPVLLTHFTGLNIILSFRFYIFFLAALSLIISYNLTQSIFDKQEKILKNLFLITLLSVFLILPVQHLGQRDNLLVILTMPYLLLTVYRLQNNSIQPYYGILVGLLAGLGFAIKPHFLLTPLLIEIYYIYSTKKWFALIKPETITISLILCLYLASIFVFFPDFVSIVLPQTVASYYNSIAISWPDLLLNNIIYFCLASIMLFYVEYKSHPYKILITTLLVSLIGFIFSYASQRTEFYYHLLPAFSIAILLISLFLGGLLKKHFHIFTFAVTLLALSFPVYTVTLLYKDGLSYKKDIIESLTSFMQTQPPNRSIYFFTQSNYSSPLRDYIKLSDNQRFDCLWMVGNLVQQRDKEGDHALRQSLKNNHDQYFFLNVIVDDIKKLNPDLIFVDIRHINTWLGGHYSYFDYIDYFSENPDFKDKWKNYRYLTTIGGDNKRYKLEVYQRTTTAEAI